MKRTSYFLLVVARIASKIVVNIAKTIIGMLGGRAHDLDNATALYVKPKEYRP